MELGLKCKEILRELGKFSETKIGLTRLYLTKEHKQANNYIISLMNDIGLEVNVDEVGNVIGYYKSKQNTNKTLYVGSHIDSVRTAGIYDGMLGIVVPIVVLGEIINKGIELPYNIKLVSFGAEEGIRFDLPYLTSKYLRGTLDEYIDRCDSKGISLLEALANFHRKEVNLKKNTLTKGEDFYLELHIEQGPVLESKNLPVGIVENINGSVRCHVEIHGEAGHAGTVPINMRKDSLVTASKIISKIRDLGVKHGVYATVGTIDVLPYSINVIPSSTQFTIDIRSHCKELIDICYTDVCDYIKNTCEEDCVKYSISNVMSSSPTKCNDKLIGFIKEAFINTNNEILMLNSGAGHDAQELGKSIDIAMIFLRCERGISHNPKENVTTEDIDILCKTFEEVLKCTKL